MKNQRTSIRRPALIDRYTARSKQLSGMCLAEFAANYTTHSGQELTDEITDALPTADDE